MTIETHQHSSNRGDRSASVRHSNSTMLALGSLAVSWFDFLLKVPGTSWLCLLAVLFGILGATILTLHVGLPHVATYGHDTFILFDGAWRVLHGQRPHVDFYSGFGPVAYLAAAGGLLLAKFAPVGVVYTTALMGLIVGLWTYALVRRRLTAWAAFLAVMYLVLLWLAPFPLGEAFYLPSYAMQYNRLGYVLLSLILLEQYLPLKPRGNSGDWAGSVSTGIAAGLLLFLKMNYFVAALLLIAGGAILQPKRRHQTAAILGAFLFTLAAFGVYLHWSYLAMFNDIVMAGLARRARLQESHGLLRALTRNITPVLCLSGLASLSVVRARPMFARWKRHPGRAMAGFVCLTLLTDLTLACSNTQRSGFPITLMATLIVACWLTSNGVSTGSTVDSRFAFSAMTTMVAIAALLPTMTDTANGWGIILAERSRTHLAASASIDAPILRELAFDDHSDPTGADFQENNGHPYTQFVNEGLALLRAHSNDEDSIGCLCFSNPFSYALLRPPASGGSSFFDYGTNFTERYLPTPDRLLGNARVIMFPKKHYGMARLNVLLEHSQEALLQRYQVVAESENWMLFKSRNLVAKGTL